MSVGLVRHECNQKGDMINCPLTEDSLKPVQKSVVNPAT